MQDGAEALEDGIDTCGSRFRKDLSALYHEVGCHFDRVFSRMLKEESQDLKGKELVNDLLVNKMSE